MQLKEDFKHMKRADNKCNSLKCRYIALQLAQE